MSPKDRWFDPEVGTAPSTEAAPAPAAPPVPGDEQALHPLRQTSRRNRVLAILVGLLLVLGIAAGGGWLWLQGQLDPSGPPGAEVVLDVPTGATGGAIADLLDAEGVIPSGTVFDLWVRYRSVDTADWQAGLHTFRLNSSVDEAIAVLDAGPGVDITPVVTLPEGLSVFARAGLPTPGPVVNRIVDPAAGLGLEEDEVMEVLLSGEVRSNYQPRGQGNLEGLIFPETYRLEDGEGASELIAKMVREMDLVLDETGYDGATGRIRDATDGALDLSPYEVLIVASLIERESRVPSERAMVARVIYNRLEANNPLGIDATTVYALGRPIETQADIDIDSPYNTRNRQGLPPTPIAIPGRASLEAALNPAEGDWFYYVLEDAEGNHFFTADESEFINKANECRDKGLC
jgi:UPF0755 protein